MKPSRSSRSKPDRLDFRVLSFDTSTAELHIALSVDGQVVSEELVLANPASGAPRQEAATILMPTIDRLVKLQGWEKKDIDAIVVGSGPGSFTGIRTSVVTARALAQALGLPLISVSLLECLALAVGQPVAIVLWATTGFYYLALIDALPNNPSLKAGKGDEDEAMAKLSYVNDEQLAQAVALLPAVYVDSPARASLALPGKELRDLPKLENIAARQTRIAWNRLSLKIKQLCEKLSGNIGSIDCDERQLRFQLRDDIRKQFPYEAVTPTYLRSPSVTVKKTND